uniref:Hermes trasposase DNA-binding domain-containing protein n=1 Tax=Acrobeloides nanus TaxID=290746 RepID=A0A914D2J2_9BILA
MAEWVSRNMRPFNIVNDKGFKNVLTTFMDIIVKRNCAIDINALLPTDRTLSNYVNSISDELVKEFGPKIIGFIGKYGGSMAVDFGKRLRDYLSICVYFIDDDWLVY